MTMFLQTFTVQCAFKLLLYYKFTLAFSPLLLDQPMQEGKGSSEIYLRTYFNDYHLSFISLARKLSFAFPNCF